MGKEIQLRLGELGNHRALVRVGYRVLEPESLEALRLQEED